MTFLEVALAVALLAGVATTILGGYGSLRSAADMQQQRLDAMEVANRLILVYTHLGPEELPDTDQYIEQGRGRYMYRLKEDILVADDNERDDLVVRRAVPAKSISSDKRIEAGFVMITINVYPFSRDRVRDSDEPLASLSRIFDPFPRLVGDERTDVLLKHLERMLNIEIDVDSLEPGGGGAP